MLKKLDQLNLKKILLVVIKMCVIFSDILNMTLIPPSGMRECVNGPFYFRECVKIEKKLRECVNFESAGGPLIFYCFFTEIFVRIKFMIYTYKYRN